MVCTDFEVWPKQGRKRLEDFDAHQQKVAVFKALERRDFLQSLYERRLLDYSDNGKERRQ